jgi:hypothetical protein
MADKTVTEVSVYLNSECPLFRTSYAVLKFQNAHKEYILLSVTKQTPGCFEHIKRPHDGIVAFHTARQQSTSLNDTEEAYCAESDLRSSKEWKSRIAKQAGFSNKLIRKNQ